MKKQHQQHTNWNRERWNNELHIVLLSKKNINMKMKLKEIIECEKEYNF